MADTPDDSSQRPTPPRSSKAAPPFFAPRTSKEGSEITEPRLRQRRSSGLFVPPGSLPPEEQELAATVERPVIRPPLEAPGAPVIEAVVAPVAEPPAEPVITPVVDPAPMRLSGYFELENLETPEITLRPGSDRPAVGGSELQVIEYGDANSGLSSTTPPGGRPSLDGLELESTELTIELSQDRARERGLAPSDLNIESFWAADAFTPSVRPSREVKRPTPPPMPERIAAAPDRPVTPAAPLAAVAPPVESEAPSTGMPEADVRSSALDALRVEEVLPPRSPTPPSVRAVTPRMPMPAFPEAPVMRTPAALEALKELEPWAVSAMERPEIAAAIAFELERVARRIRNGELRVRTDVAAPNEESALSAALQAISRTQRH